MTPPPETPVASAGIAPATAPLGTGDASRLDKKSPCRRIQPMLFWFEMTLQDLPPDVSFARLGASRQDRDFAFEAKRAAMGPHIRKMWDWEEAYQRAVHDRNYAAKPFFAIKKSGKDIGTLSFQAGTRYVRFGEFYILPEFQRRGMGSMILSHCIALADRMKMPMRLEYLHWNPVGSLYSRQGFREIGRSEIHVFLERPVSPCCSRTEGSC